ncbi:MAG: hypothetical protein FHK79_04480 [Pseudomonas sp.]|nr:MAG: hypothetical protein FHK79_04480 [Pseudomonas sp.]
MLTGILPYSDDVDSFLATARSFLEQCLACEQLRPIHDLPRLIVVNRTASAIDNNVVIELMQTYKASVVCLDVGVIPEPTAYNQAVCEVATSYVMFLGAGDIFPANFLSGLRDFLKEQGNGCAFVSLGTQYRSAKTRKYEFLAKRNTPEIVDLLLQPELVPIVFSGILVRLEDIIATPFNEELVYDYGLDFLYRLLAKNPLYALCKRVVCKSSAVVAPGVDSSRYAMEVTWYWQTLRDFLLPLVEEHEQQGGMVPAYLQYAVLYQLGWRFQLSINDKTKQVVDEQALEYFALCSRLLKTLEVRVLLSRHQPFLISQLLRYTFLHLKYEGKYAPKYAFHGDEIFLQQDEYLLLKANSQKVVLELLEFDRGDLIIEASIDNFIDFSRCRLLAFFADDPLEVEETYRYAHTKYFGVSTHKRYTFRLRIPKARLAQSSGGVSFRLDFAGNSLFPAIVTKRYTSRLCSGFPESYWMSDGYILRFSADEKVIEIQKSSLLGGLKAEVAYLHGMVLGKYRSRRMFLLRCLYWAVYPWFHFKRIWLTYDKLYKGGDCGEYFYKYSCGRTENIHPAYVVNKTAQDYSRLCQEGYRPLVYGSLRQKLHFLYAEVVFTTHGGVTSFNSFWGREISFVQNLLKFDVACIQHGLTVQQLASNSNRLFNNMKRYYCASKYEIKNLAHPVYGYENKDILRLTGIPRYDGLVPRKKKQILITPTWRSYIAMPPVKGESRPYFQGFKDTEYFRVYNSLISDSRLLDVAREEGYKIVYLLHPVVSAQLEDFLCSDVVEVLPALDINYEEILTGSSLMVTDYSGVQFDFAYMRKPIVYYHPDTLPPHYKEGGFFYETMGFGEICTGHGELVEVLCAYMRSGCQVKPLYAARQDDFFAYDDLKSCERIYDDMLVYQQEKRVNQPSWFGSVIDTLKSSRNFR